MAKTRIKANGASHPSLLERPSTANSSAKVSKSPVSAVRHDRSRDQRRASRAAAAMRSLVHDGGHHGNETATGSPACTPYPGHQPPQASSEKPEESIKIQKQDPQSHNESASQSQHPSPPASSQGIPHEDASLVYGRDHTGRYGPINGVRLVNGDPVRYIDGAVDLSYVPGPVPGLSTALTSFTSDASTLQAEDYDPDHMHLQGPRYDPAHIHKSDDASVYPDPGLLDQAPPAGRSPPLPSPPSPDDALAGSRQAAEAEESRTEGEDEDAEGEEQDQTPVPTQSEKPPLTESDEHGTTWTPPMAVPPVAPGETPLAIHVLLEEFRGHALDLTGNTTQKLLRLRKVRPLEQRKEGRKRHLNMSRRCNVDAAVLYITGVEKAVACRSCQHSHGPWAKCVVFEGEARGACANCWFNASGTRCSFKENEAQPLVVSCADPSAARDFQEQAPRGDNVFHPEGYSPVPSYFSLRGSSQSHTADFSLRRTHPQAQEEERQPWLPRFDGPSYSAARPMPHDALVSRARAAATASTAASEALRGVPGMTAHQRGVLAHIMSEAGAWTPYERLISRARAAAEELAMLETELWEMETRMGMSQPAHPYQQPEQHQRIQPFVREPHTAYPPHVVPSQGQQYNGHLVYGQHLGMHHDESVHWRSLDDHDQRDAAVDHQLAAMPGCPPREYGRPVTGIADGESDGGVSRPDQDTSMAS